MLEKIGKMAQGAAQVISSETQKQVSNAKLAELYEELGKVLYENQEILVDVSEEVATIIAKIDEEVETNKKYGETSSTAKAEIVKQKDALLGKVKCESCGATMPTSAAFCSACGTKMPEPTPEGPTNESNDCNTEECHRCNDTEKSTTTAEETDTKQETTEKTEE